MKRLLPVLLALACAAARAADAKRPVVKLDPPAEKDIPAGAPGADIRRGLELLRSTRKLLPANDPGGLDCVSCHVNDGRAPYAAPLVGAAAAFPSYLARAGRTITLAERVNDCFERSLNGKALDPGSREMKAVLAYVDWLSRGVPAGSDVEGRGLLRLASAHAPDRRNGKRVYAVRCAKCHGLAGGGRDDSPPLWGPRSFNIAASLARVGSAAAFIRRNMPKGDATLTDAQALDVAAYVANRPRPDFARKDRDWPNGGKPADARY